MTGLRRGFTLLELLVAVAVLALIVVLLNQGVLFGLRAAATQQRAEERHGDLDAIDRAIRELVAHADPGIYPEPAPFRGGAGSLTLVTELPRPSDGERERVDARLYVSGDALRLSWIPHRHVTLFGPAPPPRELVLLTGVASLQLAYFDGRAFASSWSADRLPLLVRATMRFDDERRRWPPIEVAPAREKLEQ